MDFGKIGSLEEVEVEICTINRILSLRELTEKEKKMIKAISEVIGNSNTGLPPKVSTTSLIPDKPRKLGTPVVSNLRLYNREFEFENKKSYPYSIYIYADFKFTSKNLKRLEQISGMKVSIGNGMYGFFINFQEKTFEDIVEEAAEDFLEDQEIEKSRKNSPNIRKIGKSLGS